MLRLSILGAALTSSQALLAEPQQQQQQQQPCIASHTALQDAIDALPQSPPVADSTTTTTTTSTTMTELWLCPDVPIELTEAIRIVHRSVHIGCASSPFSHNHEDSTRDPSRCTLTAQPGVETRLIEVEGGLSPHGQATNTVEFHGIWFQGGQVYDDTTVATTTTGKEGGGGAAVRSVGANMAIVDCDFSENASSRNNGGAVSVEDGNRPIFVLLQDGRFRDNWSMGRDNHSADNSCHSVYVHQQHAATMAVFANEEHASESDQNMEGSRQLLSLDQWDDPAQAFHALEAYRPQAGATLCF